MKSSRISALALAFTFCTQLRALIVLFMPLCVIFSRKIFVCKKNHPIFFLYFLFIISSIVGLVTNTVDLSNVFLYTWICIPLIYIQFSNYTLNKKCSISWSIFFINLRSVLVIINIIGFLCFFIIFRTQDDFGRGYGEHFKSVSGLAFVNAFMVLYYFSKYLKQGLKRKEFFYFLFFSISHLLCFSALTSICLIVAIAIYFLFRINWKLILSVSILGVTFYYVIKIANPEVIDYNVNNVQYFIDNDSGDNKARKKIMYLDFFKYYNHNIFRASVFGVGPGGYNSRTSFLLNKDADNIFVDIIGTHMPKYHKQYIYPLWNSNFVDQSKYNDGARNKPFSSMISIAAELGVLFFIIFCIMWLRRIHTYLKQSNHDYEFLFLFFINVFVFTSMFTEYWMESSEYLLFLLLQGSLCAYKNQIKITENEYTNNFSKD